MFQILFLFILMVFPNNVLGVSESFDPTKVLYESERDGLWEFGEGQEVELNSKKNADYLVNNETVLDFSLDETKNLWLGFELEVDTEETLLGFDDPALVVFLNDELVWKKSALELCDAGKCDWLLHKVDLGEVKAGMNRVNIYGGETGDLEQPTQLKVRNLTVNSETKSADVSGEVLGAMDIRQPLKKVVFNPWIFLVVWLVILAAFSLFWGLVNKVASRKGANYENN